MEEIEKIYIQRIIQKLDAALDEIRRVSKDDPDVTRAQIEIAKAKKHILRALNK